jgi:hypothetical protein
MAGTSFSLGKIALPEKFTFPKWNNGPSSMGICSVSRVFFGV